MSTVAIISAALTPAHQLKQLVSLRWGMIVTAAAIALIGYLLHYAVTSWSLVLLVLLTHALSNLALQHLPRDNYPLQAAFLLFCAIDLIALTALLALSGGASNGFVALLLLPVAVVSVLLPALAGYLFAAAAVLAYSLLLWLGDLTLIQPGTHSEHAMQGSVMRPFSRHMWQMWWAFVISAVLISWFIAGQAKLIRQKSARLNQLQQQQLRQEQALAIATYAANAAHDLATPIQNLLLLTEELQPLHNEQPVLQEIDQQLKRCQQIIQQLRDNAGKWRLQQPTALLPLIEHSLQSWMVTRPEISVQLSSNSDDSICQIAEPASVSSALFQILDNAADASARSGQPKLEVALKLENQQISLCIIDFGEGLSEQRLLELGQLPQSSEQGLGLGQFLANISIERLGGSIARRNLAQGGMETLIRFQQRSFDKTAEPLA